MNEYGELLDESTVRFERLLPGPIERVWRYLTEGDRRARWLCDGDVETEAGGHVDMHFHNASLSGDDDIPRPEKYSDMPEKLSFEGEVTRCEPPHLLEHTWEFEEESSLVRYELEVRGDQVRLVLTHSRLDTSELLQDVCAGWHTHLGVLEDVLAGNTPRPFYRVQARYETEYAERLGLNQARAR